MKIERIRTTSLINRPAERIKAYLDETAPLPQEAVRFDLENRKKDQQNSFGPQQDEKEETPDPGKQHVEGASQALLAHNPSINVLV